MIQILQIVASFHKLYNLFFNKINEFLVIQANKIILDNKFRDS